jgi:hypothetical protein
MEEAATWRWLLGENVHFIGSTADAGVVRAGMAMKNEHI